MVSAAGGVAFAGVVSGRGVMLGVDPGAGFVVEEFGCEFEAAPFSAVVVPESGDDCGVDPFDEGCDEGDVESV